ncbi:hypothetical protein CASFOL_023051 [Castilleja foliolosa]|uniref:Nuclear pore complex protein NUP1 n=1 Tax=Castilleja foliolosa TaxID=1961234 RepID=A0ABD3CKR4_9LAMI
MATAKEGGGTANTTSSTYGGGGAGGKFPRKPSRRSTKPYDRPLPAPRVNNDNNSSWLRKLVVEPASKLISYGADRFFAPLLRKRLPPPPPPQMPEAEADVSDGVQGAVHEIQGGVQEPPCDVSHPVNSSSSNGISELEQLLKQRTFSRSEIVHLRELLQSKDVGVSLEDVGQKNEDTASDYPRRQQFASGLLEENRNGGNRSAFMSTPIVNSKVLEDDNASPAELAKAYMGSRSSKVSPSVLGMRRRIGREDTGLLSSFPSASASPIMALTKGTPSILAAPVNGFITPRSRGRSSIYNMARTPYSKSHLTSNLKGSGINSNGFAGPSMSSSFLSTVPSHGKLESRPQSLKRRSTVLDDELGFEGSLRRTRQKSNLLASGSHHTTKDRGVIDVGENENESVPTSNYARVSSKSSEVATKILQHLEKLTPKELSESKVVARREKSPSTLTPSMLSGRGLRTMDDVNSSKVLSDVHDHKLGDRSNATLADARDFSMQKQEKIDENGPKEVVAPSYKWNHVANNDSVVSLKSSTRITNANNSNVKSGSSQPQKRRAFRMNAQEDNFEQDGDAHCNGLAPRPLSEDKGAMEVTPTDSKVAPPEEPKLERPSIQSPDKSPLALISSKTSELNSVAATLGEVSNVFSPASEETMSASDLKVLPPSVAAFDKLKEANNPPLFSSIPKVVEKVASLPSESSKEAELKIESSSSSLVNVSASTVSQVKIPESDKSPHPNHFKAGDVNGKFDFVASAVSNGPPLISSPLPVSIPAAFNDANQISIGSSALPFTSSTGSGNSVPTNTLAANTGSIFGLTANPSSSAGRVFKFGGAVDPATSVSVASTTSVSVAADLGTNTEMGKSSVSPLSNVSAFPTASSGTNTLGIGGSSVGFSVPNKLQSPLFGSGAGTCLLGTSTQSSLPAFNINSSISSGSTSSSQAVNLSNAFGFSSAVSGPSSSVFKFGASLTEGNAAVNSSSSGTTPGSTSFSFGFGSASSCSTSTNGSSTAPLFGFSANSSGSAPVTNTAASSLSSGASAVFNFTESSSASSSSAPPPSTVFGSSWQSPTFGASTFTSPSPSTGFAFSSSGLAKASPSFLSSPSINQQQPVFGSGFGAAASPDQMNAEDSMAEDTVLQTTAAAAAPAPAFPLFGQPSSSTPPAPFAFGSSPFMFGGQQNQAAPPNLSPFQASGSLDFNAGGSFSLGSGGGDKSGRKMVRISKSKNRKK